MNNEYVFTGNICGRFVSVLVDDLNDFIMASPESTIFCEDEDGNSFIVKKEDVEFNSVEVAS